MAAIAMLAACESEGNNNKKPVGPGDFTQSESKVYVDVTATTWENCNAWAWTDGVDGAPGVNYTGGEEATWPGLALTEKEEIDGVSYYVWVAPASVDGLEIGFIVNNGTEQTVDLKITPNSSDNVFVKLTEQGADGKWLASINGAAAEVPEEKPVEEPVVVLADHTWGVIGVNNWDADNFEMTVSGNTATATFDAGENAEFKVRANGAWDVNYGYATPEDGALAPVDGTEFPAAFNAGNIKVVEAGNYTLTLTIEGETETFTLKKN